MTCLNLVRQLFNHHLKSEKMRGSTRHAEGTPVFELPEHSTQEENTSELPVRAK